MYSKLIIILLLKKLAKLFVNYYILSLNFIPYILISYVKTSNKFPSFNSIIEETSFSFLFKLIKL